MYILSKRGVIPAYTCNCYIKSTICPKCSYLRSVHVIPIMVLVAYSDSEGSDDEKPQAQTTKDIQPSTTKADTKFSVDKSNPRKIKVNLQENRAEPTIPGGCDGEPASKRPRIGGGFSGFNSILPAPKRDTQSCNAAKTASRGRARKVFSLKTGAEPGFSRESDAELKQLFAEQGTDIVEEGFGSGKDDGAETTGTERGMPLPIAPSLNPPEQGNAMRFKPLSVARNTQKMKKKPPPSSTSPAVPATERRLDIPASSLDVSMAAPKVNLFSVGSRDEPSNAPGTQQAEYEPLVYHGTAKNDGSNPSVNQIEDAMAEPAGLTPDVAAETQSQSLDSIAADLHLSASAKRQLLGRNHKIASMTSSSIINFNTDQEYAANEALRALGEQVQHNPVRAIAPGKHSLKQLISAASGQKEALEESFASGRRNKKEAGGRYGW